MSSKYDPNDVSGSPMVADTEGRPVKLTEHAIKRFKARTPADRDIDIREAWQRGELIDHPSVASTGCDSLADKARVFRHSDGWSAVFVVVVDTHPSEWGRAPERAVTTVLVIEKYDHKPTQAYLEAYGPHDAGGRQ